MELLHNQGVCSCIFRWCDLQPYF